MVAKDHTWTLPLIESRFPRWSRNDVIRHLMRLPFHCGWIIVIVRFVAMATGVTAGALSLRVRPVLKEICLVRRNRHAFSRNTTAIDQPLWTRRPHQVQI